MFHFTRHSRWMRLLLITSILGAIHHYTSDASAAVRDGQACSTARPDGARWRVPRADGCVYVTSMGGTIRVPRAATDVEVYASGRRLYQAEARDETLLIMCGKGGWTFGRGVALVFWDTCGRQITNGRRTAVRVYWFAS